MSERDLRQGEGDGAEHEGRDRDPSRLARKREADAMDAPTAKRARTASESEAAADALLEEMAAEMPVEQAPTDDEALQGAH